MEILKNLVVPVTPVVVALLSMVFAWLADEIRKNVRSNRAQGILLRIDNLASTVANELWQTTVESVKSAAPGQPLDKSFAEDVKAQAVNKLKTHLGANGVKEALQVFGYAPQELEELLGSKIESAVAESKRFSGSLLSTEPVKSE